jgi:branched-chain amino acid aminotransferase
MIAYVDGSYVDAANAKISIFDRGLMHGDGVFDNVRTFGGKPFKVEEHIDRLRRSLRYIEVEHDVLIPELTRAVYELVDRNRAEINAAGDVYVIMIVTRGIMPETGFHGENAPTVIAMVKNLDFDGFGPLYEDGAELASSILTQHFAGAMDPRVKTISKGAAARAELKAGRMKRAGGRNGRGAWMVMFNLDGSIGESHASNVCILSDGCLVRPPRHQALRGVSVETLVELAEKIGLRVEERALYAYDLINADEVFITGTSYCVLPVVNLDGIELDNDRNVYSRLLEEWIELVEFDFVAQARERAGVASAALSGAATSDV